MDKVIEISNRSVADYGFRQAVLYGLEDVARRWGLNESAKTLINDTILPLLAALPVPVEPEDIPGEQARLASIIRTSARPSDT